MWYKHNKNLRIHRQHDIGRCSFRVNTARSSFWRHAEAAPTRRRCCNRLGGLPFSLTGHNRYYGEEADGDQLGTAGDGSERSSEGRCCMHLGWLQHPSGTYSARFRVGGSFMVVEECFVEGYMNSEIMEIMVDMEQHAREICAFKLA